MHTRAEVSAASTAVPSVTAPALFVSADARRRVATTAAGLLGAVTAIGAAVLLLTGVFALALMVSRVRDTSPGALIGGLASDAAPISVIGALLLSTIVVTAFGCGGYVAARLGGSNPRAQAIAVWVWAVCLPALLLLVALLSAAREVVTAMRPNGAVVLLLLTLATMALLGSLIGGESARRTRREP